MDFSTYQKTVESNLPPNLEVGQVLKEITSVTENTFQLNGVETKGMRVFADGKEYRTSSTVLMKQLTEFFKANPKETLQNVKVTIPRGKRYMKLESA